MKGKRATEKNGFPGVGLIVAIPGRPGLGGHTDSAMLVSIFDQFHDKIHIITSLLREQGRRQK